jgi:hypothetical protein
MRDQIMAKVKSKGFVVRLFLAIRELYARAKDNGRKLDELKARLDRLEHPHKMQGDNFNPDFNAQYGLGGVRVEASNEYYQMLHESPGDDILATLIGEDPNG